MNRQNLVFVGIGVFGLLAYPWVFRSNYAINVGFLVLFAAYLGQTWNIAGGFAGQTSFGHVVFFGVGAYVSTILQVTYGVNPWIAWPVSALAGAAVGWLIAVLSFRAGLKGSYFALITLAVAEVGRIVANSVPITKGGLGILITADPRAANFQFREPVWFYYLALALWLLEYTPLETPRLRHVGTFRPWRQRPSRALLAWAVRGLVKRTRALFGGLLRFRSFLVSTIILPGDYHG